jgi:adenylate cyclase
MDRKLAAILSADVKGYSRLMGEDEMATVRTLTAYREVMVNAIHQRKGRVVDSPGDNLLAEFASVVDAVECAVGIQETLDARNSELPETRRMEYRMGINLGDVIVDGERIYGDGVNIAARIEALAEGGGVCLSGTAYDQVEGKLPYRYEALGEHAVKNIARPVRVYRVLMSPSLVSSTVRPALDLPDKPSIAVLPFANIGQDSTQDPLADGLTEEIITTLSKIAGVFVIASSSVFTYKGKPAKIQEVARELGVRYVLEGSIRRGGDRVRVIAQLIDTSTGFHLWAERYEGALDDIFGLQDLITQKIVTELEVKLTEGEQARLWRRSTRSVVAYEDVLRARQHIRSINPEQNALGRQLCEHAIALDPSFPYAHVLLGWTYAIEARAGWTTARTEALNTAARHAEKAISLDATQADAHTLLGNVLMQRQQPSDGLPELEKAITLDPGNADAWAFLSAALSHCERPEDGLAAIKNAMRLSPVPPSYYYGILGLAYRLLGRYEEALAAHQRQRDVAPDSTTSWGHLALVYAYLGRATEARSAVSEALRLDPKWSLTEWLQYQYGKLDRDLEALKRIGLA